MSLYTDDCYIEEDYDVNYDKCPPDCLVLQIFANNDIPEFSTKIFIWYDKNQHRFFLRGKNYESENTFNFKSKKSRHIADFLTLILDKRSFIEVEMYNFTELPEDSNDITFEFLQSDSTVEIIYTNYDYPLQHNELKRIIKMLSKIYNNY